MVPSSSPRAPEGRRRAVLGLGALSALGLALALRAPGPGPDSVFEYDPADARRTPAWVDADGEPTAWFDGTLRAGPDGPVLHARRASGDHDVTSPWHAFAVERDGAGRATLRALELADAAPAPYPAAPEPASPTARRPRHLRRVEGADGAVCEVWDVSDGRSFDVLARWTVDGEVRGPFLVAGGPAFEARPELARDSRGDVWCLWEEGGENWGAPHRGAHREWNTSTDDAGPLHRLRRLRLARLTPDGRVHELVEPFPQPAFERLRAREDRREGVRDLGGYYERGALGFDREDRLWVAWGHCVNTQAGCADATVHHVDEGWRVYARCLSGDAWGPVTTFEGPLRDGLQELSLLPFGDGVLLCWSAGRRDRRRQDSAHRGVAYATLDPGPGAAAAPELRAREARRPAPALAPRARGEVVAGMRAYLGDLHRHTDLSLCFPFFDGSVDDAYRYGRDVAELDFLALTDHTRDLDHGDVDGPLWERVREAVERNHEPGRFVTLHAFERSNGETDHNVITLDPGVLEDFQPPLAEYWGRIDPARTITIPHNPFLARVWEMHDDARRPLAEVYQGCRDQDSLEHLLEGWDRGQRFGVIASSDHMSTSASYAGVWAPELTREALFEALRARRTYGATAPIRLAVRLDDAWMGEAVPVRDAEPRTLTAEVWGTAPVRSLELWIDGERMELLSPDPQVPAAAHLREEFRLSFHPEAGPERLMVTVEQEDGERAWSSPIFLERAP